MGDIKSFSMQSSRRSCVRILGKPLFYILPRLGQFRSVEVATLEKGQRHLKNSALASLELKFLSTFRQGTSRTEPFFAQSRLGLLFDNTPSPTFRTRDDRARNAIGHTKLYGVRV